MRRRRRLAPWHLWPRKRSLRLALMHLLGVLAASTPAVAAAQEGLGIEVGSVSSVAAGSSDAALVALHDALDRAAPAVASSMGRLSGRLVLDGTLTRLERQSLGNRFCVRCEVSLLVLEHPGGEVRVLLTGRAVSIGLAPRSEAERAAIERGAIASAATTALARLSAELGEE